MKVSATQKHARMSPRKIRPYARMVQGMSAAAAETQLAFAVGKAPELLLTVLRSAVANAKNNLSIEASDLKVSSILINQGLVMKRYMPVSKGMAHPILKRTSHITITVEGGSDAAKPKKAKKAEKIETITAGEFVALEEKEHDHEEHELSEQHLEKHAQEERTIEKTTDKKTGVFQKIKTNQQGSDAKKSHRRKSIG